jgi:pyruvate kinase
MPTLPGLVVTLGPASAGKVPALLATGATGFRLNASHLVEDELCTWFREVRAAAPIHPLVIDLQGAKLRLGRFAERTVAEGDRVRFAAEAGEGEVPLPHPELFAAVKAGDTLRLDDGRVRLRVEAVTASALDARALHAAVLRPRKGVNVAEHPVELEDLTAADLAALRCTTRCPDVSFAVSFVRDGRELGWIRKRTLGCPVIAKIERREAIDSLRRIEETADDVWLCRGDLGAQLGVEAMADFVARFRPTEHPRPIYMAGQVLEHLAAHPEPTRSEVCHLFDLVYRGYAGIVLSDETAIGHDPVAATATASRLLRAAWAAR